MDKQEFHIYQKKMQAHLREMLVTRPPHALDEQAVPSYTHNNPVVAHLFWSRIRKVMEYLEDINNTGNVLDFGCGPGILFPFLISHGARLTAFDVDLSAAQEMAQRFSLSNKICFLSDRKALEALAGSFDTILALDVLEHVDNLAAECALLRHLIKPKGYLIVSGPTESPLYRLGRWLAGYSYHFHQRNIYDIERELAQHFSLQWLTKLYPGITLFRISVWIPRS